MLSKSVGQILRVSAAMHVLFSIGDDSDSDVIECECQETGDASSYTVSSKAIEAAIDFVQTCFEQTACIAGKNASKERGKNASGV
jgi:hypothetical protein